MILFFLIDAITAPLWISVQATVKIRNYQMLIAGIIILNFPFSYFALKLGMAVYSVFLIRVFLNLVTFFVRIVYLKYNIGLPVRSYIVKVVWRVCLISLFSIPIPILLKENIVGWLGVVLSTCSSFIIVLLMIYRVGLSSSERKYIRSMVLSKLNRYE